MVFYTVRHPWGPYLWGYIHTVSLMNDKEHVKQILLRLLDCIACSGCQDLVQEMKESLEQVDETSSNIALFYWTVNIHNRVNSKLGKEQWSYQQALDTWAIKIL
jgi:Na+-translocating ferredoxin:NAD+ oxidoreductase RnfC subunit